MIAPPPDDRPDIPPALRDLFAAFPEAVEWHAVALQQWREYIALGAPHGETVDGWQRWAGERWMNEQWPRSGPGRAD